METNNARQTNTNTINAAHSNIPPTVDKTSHNSISNRSPSQPPSKSPTFLNEGPRSMSESSQHLDELDSEASSAEPSFTPTYPPGTTEMHPSIVKVMKDFMKSFSFNHAAFSGFENNKAIWAISAAVNDRKDKCWEKYTNSLNHFIANIQQKAANTPNLTTVQIALSPYGCVKSFNEFIVRVCGAQFIDWINAYEHMARKCGGELFNKMVECITSTLTVRISTSR